MTAQNRATLKALFETGDTVTQSSFENLIDSFLDLVDTGAQTIASPVTFSNAVTFSSAVSFVNGTVIPVSAGGTGLSSVSAYAIMVGNNSATISLVSPSATSGIPLISQGVSANPTFGTAVVAGGGTGLTTITTCAPIFGGSTPTGNLQVGTVGTTGQVLTSNGAGAIATFQNAQAGILSTVYPVGTIYWNKTDSTNPATLFGFGTWVAVTDKFIVARGSTYTATGGSATVTLTTNELPAHAHGYPRAGGASLNGGSVFPIFDGSSGNVFANTTSSTGSGGAFSIIPPYQAVYCWERTV